MTALRGCIAVPNPSAVTEGNALLLFTPETLLMCAQEDHGLHIKCVTACA